MWRKFETQDFHWYGLKRIKSVFDARKGGERFGHLCSTSSSFQFLNKTGLEQYLFKNLSAKK